MVHRRWVWWWLWGWEGRLTQILSVSVNLFGGCLVVIYSKSVWGQLLTSLLSNSDWYHCSTSSRRMSWEYYHNPTHRLRVVHVLIQWIILSENDQYEHWSPVCPRHYRVFSGWQSWLVGLIWGVFLPSSRFLRQWWLTYKVYIVMSCSLSVRSWCVWTSI